MLNTTEIDRHTERRNFLLRLFVSLRAAPDDKEDLAQQSLLRFLSQGYAERGLAEKQENALLARIGYSTFIDSCRKKRASNLGDREHELSDETLDLKRNDQFEEIKDLIVRSNLELDDIRLIELRFGDGNSIVDIARLCDVHVNTIRRRLERIINHLRRQAAIDCHTNTDGRAQS